MNHIFILKNFISFLKRNKAYETYLHYLVKSYGKDGVTQFLISKVNYASDFLISMAFYWGETNEGYSYWNKLHYKWSDRMFLIHGKNR